jgi:hypothetical protein
MVAVYIRLEYAEVEARSLDRKLFLLPPFALLDLAALASLVA